MPGTKKLNSDELHENLANDQMSETLERQLATLLRNELINGDDQIARRVMDAGTPRTLSQGEKFIGQGASDDCVYFMLSGRVDVRINGQHIDFRSAPYTVGEMAAKKAGELRTADVIVSSAKLETLVVSGTEFRSIMREFPSFTTNLENAIDRLTRQKISQLGERGDKHGGSPAKKIRSWWTAISAGAGAVAGLIAGIGAWFAHMSAFEIALAILALGLLVFVCVLLANPLLRYRNMASSAGYALIGLTLYGSLSFALTIDGKAIDLPLVDFSVHTELKLGALAISCVTLLLLTWLGGRFDLKLEKGRED